LLAGLRRFAPSTRAIDADWCSSFSSGDTWTPTGIRWQTNTGPLQLANAKGLLGVQKPGHGAPSNPHTAATEKIVADLASVFGLPVPPVTLWDRGTAAGEPRYVAVSAWAFQQPLTWAQAEPQLNADQKAQLARPASTMIPFESWIGAQDRQNAGNVLVSVEQSGEIVGAWIDYAFALDHTWKGNDDPNCTVTTLYPQCGAIDTAAMKSVADLIV